MKRKLLIIFIIFGLTAELAFVVSKFFAVAKNKTEVVEKLSDVIGADIDVKGRIELKIFPIPKLVISHIRVNNYRFGKYNLNIRSPRLTGTVSVMRFLQGDIKLSKIKLDNAKLDAVIQNQVNDGNNINRITDITNSGLNLKHLIFYNSSLQIINERNNTSKKYNNLNLDIIFANKISVTSSFATNIEKFHLNGLISRDENNNLLSDFKIKFSDNLLNINTEKDPQNNTIGTVKITGKDIQKFTFNNLLSAWFFFPDNKPSDFESSFNFEIKNKNIKITNGEIKGESIEGYFIGNIKHNDIGNINIKLKNLNLDTLLTDQKKTNILEEMGYLDLLDQANSFPILINNGKILVTGTLEQLTVKENIRGPIEYSIFLDQNLPPRIENFSFQITPEDFHNISGILQHGNNKYQFAGKYNSNGESINKLISTIFPNIKFDTEIKEKYSFNSNFTISTDYFKIDDLTFTTSNNGIITGDVNIDFSEEQDSTININTENIDFNKFLILNDKEEQRHILHHIYQKLASREQGGSLLRSMLWLRNLYIPSVYNINLNNSKYNNAEFEKIILLGNIKHRELKLTKLQLNSKDNDITISSIIDLDEKRPYFNIDIDAKKVNPIFLEYGTESSYSWSKDLVYIPNFTNMDFNLNAKFENFKYHELVLNNVELVAEVRDDIMDIQTAKGNIDENGTFNAEGKLILDGLPTLNLTYNINNFQINNFINFFFNIPHFYAMSNWAGSLYTSGNTPYIMAKQLKSKNTFYLADIKIDKLAIPKIVQEIANLSANPINSFKTSLETLIRSGHTKFKTTNGTINIKNGVILIDNIKLNTPNLQAVFAGKVSLVDFAIKLNSVFIFTAFYKVKSDIKKTSLTLTHGLDGRFDNITGNFNLLQLESFVKQLKEKYIKLYDKLSDEQ